MPILTPAALNSGCKLQKNKKKSKLKVNNNNYNKLMRDQNNLCIVYVRIFVASLLLTWFDLRTQ
jgi:hypothetical protein